LRQAVVAYAESCGASERRREDIALAVSEAVSNAVLHAYVGRQDATGAVAVEAWMEDDKLAVVVLDEGGGMSRRDDSPGLGLGLGLIERMADTLELDEARPGLRVRMTFALA
jgi:serine/threonine-protein kinase RsbW